MVRHLSHFGSGGRADGPLLSGSSGSDSFEAGSGAGGALAAPTGGNGWPDAGGAMSVGRDGIDDELLSGVEVFGITGTGGTRRTSVVPPVRETGEVPRPSSMRGGTGLLGNGLVSAVGDAKLLWPDGLPAGVAVLPLAGWTPDVFDRPFDIGGLSNFDSGSVVVAPGAVFASPIIVGVAMPVPPVVEVFREATAGVPQFLLRQFLQQSPQPVRAIPAQTRPMIVTTGFLPIGFPFPG